MQKKRLIVGLSGASGAMLGERLLMHMQTRNDWETHLVMTPAAERTIALELGKTPADIASLASHHHAAKDIGASIASGTFACEGMVVIPCSMRSLAAIAHGISDNLLLRSADVMLKEHRRLVLVAREAPLSRIHLANMSLLAEYGAEIVPPMMSFYHHPTSIEDMADHLIGRILAGFGIEISSFRRWGESDDSRENDPQGKAVTEPIPWPTDC